MMFWRWGRVVRNCYSMMGMGMIVTWSVIRCRVSHIWMGKLFKWSRGWRGKGDDGLGKKDET